MPWEWDIDPQEAPAQSGASSYGEGERPLAAMHLWPYRSLPRRGFVAVIGVAFLAFLVPLSAFLGTASLWWILLPVMGVLWLLWFFIDKSYRDAEILEELRIWRDRITLTRHGPQGQYHEWEANPYWVSIHLYRTGGPVENYVTLKGNSREVELGAFLSEEERPGLYREVAGLLRQVKTARPH